MNPLIVPTAFTMTAGGRPAPLGGARLLLATAAIGAVHHVDHVLRSDHSGWPFTAEVTPFTVSLLVYPVLFLVHGGRTGAWLRAALVGGILLATQAAHLLIETPYQQYAAWADGTSADPTMTGVPNLLGITSPALGMVAAGWSFLLSAALIATTVALVIDARRGSTRRVDA